MRVAKKWGSQAAQNLDENGVFSWPIAVRKQIIYMWWHREAFLLCKEIMEDKIRIVAAFPVNPKVEIDYTHDNYGEFIPKDQEGAHNKSVPRQALLSSLT